MSDRATTYDAPAPPPPPAPRQRARGDDPSGTFAAVAALGAAFAGFVSHEQNPDLLATALAVGITFVGAFVALHALRLLFRLTVAVTKVAIPIAAILLLGCALDWHWAERASDWLLALGRHGAAAAGHAVEALRAG